MTRRVVVLAFAWAFMILSGVAFGREECKTPLFITTSVTPNVLIVFDTSGSMRNVMWHESFDRRKLYHMVDSQGGDDRLLPVDSDQVVFAQRAGSCSYSPHKVYRDRGSGRVVLDHWKVVQHRTDICDSVRMRGGRAAWSDGNGYFYFDRLEKGFISSSAYRSDNPNHVRVFLPYVNTGRHPSVSTAEYTAYDYNYLNWIFYRSTKTERDEIEKSFYEEQETLTRILTLQTLIKQVVQNNPGVRFGVMSFDGESGGLLIAPVGTDADTISSKVDNLWADGLTPLAETLEDVWEHFKEPEGPIQYWCQKSFVIVMTDGLPTSDADDLSAGMKKNWDLDRGGKLEDSEEDVYPTSGSDYLDDIAYYIFENDARPDLQMDDEIRNIRTFTIGAITASDLLRETAFNGNGIRDHMAEWDDPDSDYYHRFYYLADNLDELRKAIESALVEVSLANSSGTAVSVTSSSASASDLVFRASFNSAGWMGFLEAFQVTGGADFGLGEPVWEAGQILKETLPDNRQIYTALKSTTGIDDKLGFTEANVSETDVDDRQLFKLLNQESASQGKDIIRFIRGADVEGFRDRGGYKLGDIIDSTPVVVGPPGGYFSEASYIQFRRDHALRERMLYVGANDGMLHAFHVDDALGGTEAWAFVPSNLLGKLEDLTFSDYDACHGYFVDLTPTVADVFIDREGVDLPEWRTVLIGGEREGGKAYFALDVTEPASDAFAPMWEFSDPRLGESWSVPSVEKIKLGETDRWLAFVGNGFNNDDRQAYLFAIDIESGANLREPIGLGSGSPNVLASPRVVDINGDNYADSIFAGDLQGTVWRFDITDQTGDPKTFEPLDPAEWQAQEIFQTLPEQPVVLPMGLSFYCTSSSDQHCQNVMTYFGTGKYLTADDKTETSLQSFYAIKDEFISLTRDEMEDRTVSESCPEEPDPYAVQGWFVDLTTEGERVSSSALVMGGLVFFLTFIPDDDPCNAGGTTWLYYREFDTGCVPNRTVSSRDPDPEGEGRPVGKILIGAGYATEMVYYAQTQDMLIQTSDRKIHSLKVILPRGGIENYAWREVFY